MKVHTDLLVKSWVIERPLLHTGREIHFNVAPQFFLFLRND